MSLNTNFLKSKNKKEGERQMGRYGVFSQEDGKAANWHGSYDTKEQAEEVASKVEDSGTVTVEPVSE